MAALAILPTFPSSSHQYFPTMTASAPRLRTPYSAVLWREWHFRRISVSTVEKQKDDFLLLCDYHGTCRGFPVVPTGLSIRIRCLTLCDVDRSLCR
jgi:hypothetical protein